MNHTIKSSSLLRSPDARKLAPFMAALGVTYRAVPELNAMSKQDGEVAREYKAIVWSKDPSSVGQRVTVMAKDGYEARAIIEAQFGTDIICSIWNEEDANAPR